ncbi:MAG: FAD-binding oxidoreductase [Gammaproteobacteria bacterium]|nr:FAD-binding oxidoreductase [Gammaproteobacteria bacterium]MDH3363404.1 FAD-binding oxidoreductase [Gammaproteobacteria bacterium]MDH3481485.1 FAD-binding oxidoreductase [Gammaproteobacteria bacterium]
MSDGGEHTRSYYAATANVDTNFARLEGEHRCDVVIVGGGFTGVSAMLHLAERGYDVMLLEANRIGWGASGRNGGQLIDGFVEEDKIEQRLGADAAKVAYEMGLECRDIVIERIEKYAIDCDLKYGYLDLALRDSDMRDFERTIDAKIKAAYPHAVRLIRKEEMQEYIGSDRYLGGLVNLGNGHLHPLNLCIGEALAAENLGARIFERSAVTRIRNGAAPQVQTATGTVRAGKILLAGNAYLGGVESKLSGSVIPAGSYIIATAPLSHALARNLLPHDMACCDQRAALDYFRLSADKRLLFGGMCNYSGRVPRSIAGALRPKMLKVFPQLADTRIDYEWGGNIAISVNRIPQLGRIENNTYFAQGYSGHGVAPTHLAGKILADIVAGDSEQFDVFSKIRHRRLPGGRWFANPALALGMLYLRVKDRL